MSLDSYAGLQSEVAGYLNRTDLTDNIPTFIQLCEADLRRRVVHDFGMTDRVTLTANDGAVTLPDDFNGVRTLKGAAGRLKFTALDVFDGYADTTGNATEYTLSGGKAFLFPTPEDGATFTLTYRVKMDLLKFGPQWLFENHPDAYLYGAMIHAEPYIVEDERVPLWRSTYEGILRDIELDGIRQSTGGTLQVSSNGPR